MNKQTIIGLFLISILILLSNIAIAETTEIKDTTIDYVGYREIVVDEPGVIYKIKITNTGTGTRDYEIIPDSEIIRNLGTYKINPSDKITLASGEQETIYFYLAVEKDVAARTVIPVEIKSGLSETKINLVARPIGPLQSNASRDSRFLSTAFKTILIIVIIIIIVLALLFGFRKIRNKKEKELNDEFEPDFDEDIGSYY